jgi:hypothetical protein
MKHKLVPIKRVGDGDAFQGAILRQYLLALFPQPVTRNAAAPFIQAAENLAG